MREPVSRLIRRSVGVGAVAALLGLIGAPGAMAQTDIQSAGPLTDIFISPTTDCQVAHTGDDQFEFFPSEDQDGSCGTDVSIGGQLFGPAGNGWSAGSQSGVTGAGTAADPLALTTIVEGLDPSSDALLATLTEKDSYVVGSEFYRTDMTVTNNTSSPQPVTVYHAADCFLQGSDSGFGFLDAANGTVGCTQTANDSPAALIEEFAPLTPGDHYFEGGFDDATDVIPGGKTDYPDTCDCNGNPGDPGFAEDNGEGLNWDTTLAPGQSQTFSMISNFSPNGVTTLPIPTSGGSTFSGRTGTAVGGTLATFSAASSDVAGNFTATVNWGDGSSTAGTVGGSGGSFTVTGSHAYGTGGTFPITVTIVRTSNTQNRGTATDTASITAPPSPVLTGSPSVTGSSAAAFSGSVVPDGLPTTVHFEYGLDSKYSKPGTSGPVYDQSTPAQSAGSGFTSQPVSASVSGLVPNALYHVRLVATNSAGTTNGPDVAFTTAKGPAPTPPTLGQSFTGSPTGLVLIEVNGKFVPITELTKIPNGAVINALKGTLNITTAGVGNGPRAKGAKAKTQTGSFGGAIFKVTQSKGGKTKGLTNLSLVEGLKGGPSYASCKAKAKKASIAALSSKTLQLLHGKAHGKFRTTGRYSAATIRGTVWTVADRCDGTLTHAIKDVVTVTDFVRHKTIQLHPGHSYLALANPPKVKKPKTHK
jgi:hypothetical protein